MSFATIPMDQFKLKWRFNDSKYDVLPPIHLAQVKPLAPADARHLRNRINEANLHKAIPFTEGYFRSVVSTSMSDSGEWAAEERRVRKWLYQRGIPFQQRVWLSYDGQCGIETTWKILIKYWSAFYYPSSDDLTVIDGSFNWALFFFHEDEVFFGSNLPTHRS